MTTHAYTLLAIVASVISGCEVEDLEIGESSEELLNGTVTYDRPEVGQVFSPYAQGCTGTLVSETVVLTAAHCVGYQSGPQGGWFMTGNHQWFHFYEVHSASSSSGASDLAMLHLDGRLPWWVAQPAPITADVPWGHYVTVFGYGCTNRASPTEGVGVKRSYTYPLSSNPRQLCPGDSGGPTFDPWGRIFFVNSAYNSSGDDIYAHFSGAHVWNFFWAQYLLQLWAPPPPVTLHEHSDFWGAGFSGDGHISWVGGEWNDRISSVRVPANRVVILYEHADFGGAELVLYAGDYPYLGWYGGPGPEGTWNDAASSVRIW